MKLRAKVGWVVLAVFASIIVVGYLLTYRLLLPQFLAIEGQGAHREVVRLRVALQDELDQVADLGRMWNESGAVATPVDEVSIPQPAIASSRAAPAGTLDFVAVYDREGTLRDRWSSSATPGDADLPDHLAGTSLPPGSPLRSAVWEDGPRTGMLATRTGVWMVAYMARRPSVPGDPSPGILVVGRVLDRKALAALGRRIQVDFEAWPPGAAGLPADLADMAAEGSESRGDLTREFESHVESVGAIAGLDGRPALLFRTDFPLGIWTRGRFILDAGAVALTVAGVLIGFLMYVMIRAIVVAPLSDLTHHITNVGREGDLSARLHSARRDEIGSLAVEFDRMLEQLEKMQGRLVEVSHLSGMATISRNVIHNLGNALNSVWVPVQGMSERARITRGPAITRTVEALRARGPDLGRFLAEEEQGQNLLNYLSKLAVQMNRDDEVLAADLVVLNQNLLHMNEVIQAHRVMVKKGEAPLEQVTLVRLATLSLNMVQSTLAKSGIRIEREYEETPPLWLERVKVVEVLVNLLTNAKEACLLGNRRDRVIHVRVVKAPHETVCIEVQDNGVGMSPDQVATLFDGGSSTKGPGRGQGLRFCAQAVEEMGGRIRATSPGPDLGSTVTVSFPVGANRPGNGRSLEVLS